MSESHLPFVVERSVPTCVARLVSSAAVDAQVRDIVIKLVPVHMIYEFFCRQWATEGFRHYKTVFRDAFCLSAHGFPEPDIIQGNSLACKDNVAFVWINLATWGEFYPVAATCSSTAFPATPGESVSEDMMSGCVSLSPMDYSARGTSDGNMRESLTVHLNMFRIGPVNLGVTWKRMFTIFALLLEQTIFVTVSGPLALFNPRRGFRRIIPTSLFAPGTSYQDFEHACFRTAKCGPVYG